LQDVIRHSNRSAAQEAALILSSFACKPSGNP
jgi:hypothetical protein